MHVLHPRFRRRAACAILLATLMGASSADAQRIMMDEGPSQGGQTYDCEDCGLDAGEPVARAPARRRSAPARVSQGRPVQGTLRGVPVAGQNPAAKPLGKPEPIPGAKPARQAAAVPPAPPPAPRATPLPPERPHFAWDDQKPEDPAVTASNAAPTPPDRQAAAAQPVAPQASASPVAPPQAPVEAAPPGAASLSMMAPSRRYAASTAPKPEPAAPPAAAPSPAAAPAAPPLSAAAPASQEAKTVDAQVAASRPAISPVVIAPPAPELAPKAPEPKAADTTVAYLPPPAPAPRPEAAPVAAPAPAPAAPVAAPKAAGAPKPPAEPRAPVRSASAEPDDLVVFLAVRADIRTVGQLSGKPVAMGKSAPGSAATVVEDAFASAGVTPRAVDIAGDDAIKALMDGKVAAATVLIGPPMRDSELPALKADKFRILQVPISRRTQS